MGQEGGDYCVMCFWFSASPGGYGLRWQPRRGSPLWQCRGARESQARLHQPTAVVGETQGGPGTRPAMRRHSSTGMPTVGSSTGSRRRWTRPAAGARGDRASGRQGLGATGALCDWASGRQGLGTGQNPSSRESYCDHQQQCQRVRSLGQTYFWESGLDCKSSTTITAGPNGVRAGL
jgi:hypothetical protein